MKPLLVPVKPAFRWLWRAWHVLHDERAWIVQGFAAPLGAVRIESRPGRIPWSRMAEWARHRGLSTGEEILLVRCLRAMDDVFEADWLRRQRNREKG